MAYSRLKSKEKKCDIRVFKCTDDIISLIVKNKNLVVSKFTSNRAEATRGYRLLNNRRLSLPCLIQYFTSKTFSKMQAGEHYLAIEDTTQFNFNNHTNRLKTNTLGVIGDNKSIGFFLHPVLMVGSETGLIGFGAIDIYERPIDRDPDKKKNRKKLPVESKESGRWLKVSQEVKNKHKDIGKVTFVCDREGGFHQMFDRIPSEYDDVLIRLTGKRKTKESDTEKELANSAVLGIINVEIRGDTRKKVSSRIAQIEIRAVKVTLTPKAKEIQADGTKVSPNPVEVYLVEAKEVNSTVSKPIHWVLVTTHEVINLTQAQDCIGWYEERWYIETLFRLLKNEGLQFEDSELETGEALKRQIILGLEASLQIMMLYIGYKKKSRAPAENIFTEQEVKALHILKKKYEGKTQKQKNPYEAETVAWAAWTIARMGGWKGYESQRPPGVLTFFEGLKYFNQLLNGRIILNELSISKIT